MAMNGKGNSYRAGESELAEMVSNGKRPSQYSIIGTKQARATCSLTIVVLFIVSMILVVVGISLIIVSSAKEGKCQEDSVELAYCAYSPEAKRAKLDKILEEMSREFFRLHPHQSYHDPTMEDADYTEMKRMYAPFDPSPDSLKRVTDASLALLQRLNALNVSKNRLKPRERKSYIQAKHYLKHTFGQPYDVDYYAADWMLGPNHFCWQPVCDIGKDIFYHLDYFQPYGLEDLKHLR